MSILDSAPPISPARRLMSEKTPMPSITDQRTTAAITIAMPTPTDSRNESFSTDHGSTLARVSRTRRGPVRGAWGVATGAPVGTPPGGVIGKDGGDPAGRAAAPAAGSGGA